MITSMTPNPHREAGHTPGPWQANGNAIQTETGEYVANLSSPRGAEQRERDAGLIAAAPELYEAGEELADKLWILSCESRDEKSRAAAEAAIAMWNAAKAKARGESA
jgi:hypothetical protein